VYAAIIRLILGIAGQLLTTAIARLRSRSDLDAAVKSAQVHVTALMNVDTLTNDQKRAEAIKLVKADLAKAGKILADSAASLAVELALQGAKAAVEGIALK
jgi:hypothetical protein